MILKQKSLSSSEERLFKGEAKIKASSRKKRLVCVATPLLISQKSTSAGIGTENRFSSVILPIG